jgi:hypothetical protein
MAHLNHINPVRGKIQINEAKGSFSFVPFINKQDETSDTALTFPHNLIDQDASSMGLLKQLLRHDWHDSLSINQEGFCVMGLKVVPNCLYVLSLQIDVVWHGLVELSPECNITLLSGTSDWKLPIPQRITRKLNTIEYRLFVPPGVELIHMEVAIVHQTDQFRGPYELIVPTHRLSLLPLPGSWNLQRCVRSNQTHNHRIKNNISSLMDQIYVLHSHSTLVSQTFWVQQQVQDLFGLVPHVQFSVNDSRTLEHQPTHKASTCEHCFYNDSQWLSLVDKSTPAAATINKNPLIKERREQFIEVLSHSIANKSQRILLLNSEVSIAKDCATRLQTLYNNWPAQWNIVLLGAYEHLPNNGTTTVLRNNALSLEHFMPLKSENHSSHFAMMLNGIAVQQDLLRYLQKCSTSNSNPFPTLFKATDATGFVAYPNIFMPHSSSPYQRQYQKEQQSDSLTNLQPTHPFYWNPAHYAHSTQDQGVDNAMLRFNLQPTKSIHVILVWDTVKRTLEALRAVISNMNLQSYVNWQLHVFTSQPDGVAGMIRESTKSQNVWLHPLAKENTSWSVRLLDWLDQVNAKDLVTFWDGDSLCVPERLNLQASWWLSQPEPPSVHVATLPVSALHPSSRGRQTMQSQETFIATYGVTKSNKKCKIASASYMTLMASASAFRTELLRYQESNGTKLTMRVLSQSALQRMLEQLFLRLENVYTVPVITQAMLPRYLVGSS